MKQKSILSNGATREKLEVRDIKNWDISAVTSRYKMFYNCPCGDVFASAA